jgi:hypothetical protein
MEKLSDPPSFLLQDTPVPPPLGEGATAKDLAVYAVKLQTAIRQANADKKAIRKILNSRPLTLKGTNRLLPIAGQLAPNEPEYLSAELVRTKLIGILSPVRFVELLREHREELPLYGLTSNDRDFFYGICTEPISAVDMLDRISIHALDWLNFLRTMEQEEAEPQSGDPPCSTEEVDTPVPQLAETQRRIASLEEENASLKALLAAEPVSDAAQSNGGNPWKDAATAIYKAVMEVIQGCRRDWVSGIETGTGDTDSAGKETFRALLKRMHPKGIRCPVEAEKYAWIVLSRLGYTHKGGRKPNP